MVYQQRRSHLAALLNFPLKIPHEKCAFTISEVLLVLLSWWEKHWSFPILQGLSSRYQNMILTSWVDTFILLGCGFACV